MPSPLDLTQIPRSSVPFIDPRTQLMSREWYRFFLNLFSLAGSGSNETSLTDLQVGPNAPEGAGVVHEALMLAQLGSSNPLSVEQISEVITRVEALEMLPPFPPVLQPAVYGLFSDTTNQTAAVANTGYAVTFNTTGSKSGTSLGTPTSRIVVDHFGVYFVQFSIQFDSSSAPSESAYVWLSVNGVDVVNSGSQTRIRGTTGEVVVTRGFLVSLGAGDYIEVKWSVSDIAISLAATIAGPPVPVIPSAILVITDVNT